VIAPARTFPCTVRVTGYTATGERRKVTFVARSAEDFTLQVNRWAKRDGIARWEVEE
jgi:hypothetical protein